MLDIEYISTSSETVSLSLKMCFMCVYRRVQAVKPETPVGRISITNFSSVEHVPLVHLPPKCVFPLTFREDSGPGSDVQVQGRAEGEGPQL